jgi:alpha-tubulin suppressor-like RCC1 family protein
VAAGAHHTLLVTESGGVYCCGLNADGQCGIGAWQAKVEQLAKMALAPHLVAYLGACGALHSVVVARHAEEYGCESERASCESEQSSERARARARERERDSLVLTCGSGGCWQLGAGSSQVDRRVPELVCGLPEGLRVTSVTCGMFHTLCVAEEEEDGHKSFWAWGADLFGDLRKLHVQPQVTSSLRPHALVA